MHLGPYIKRTLTVVAAVFYFAYSPSVRAERSATLQSPEDLEMPAPNLLPQANVAGAKSIGAGPQPKDSFDPSVDQLAQEAENRALDPAKGELSAALADYFHTLTGWPRDKVIFEPSRRTLFSIVTRDENKSHPDKLTIYYNPKFLFDLPTDNTLAFVLLHEYYHEIAGAKANSKAAQIKLLAEKKLKENGAEREVSQDSIRHLLKESFALANENHSDIRAVVHMLRLGMDVEQVSKLFRSWIDQDAAIASEYMRASHPQSRSRVHAVEGTLEFAKGDKSLAPYGTQGTIGYTHIADVQKKAKAFERAALQFSRSPEYSYWVIEANKAEARSAVKRIVAKNTELIDHAFEYFGKYGSSSDWAKELEKTPYSGSGLTSPFRLSMGVLSKENLALLKRSMSSIGRFVPIATKTYYLKRIKEAVLDISNAPDEIQARLDVEKLKQIYYVYTKDQTAFDKDVIKSSEELIDSTNTEKLKEAVLRTPNKDLFRYDPEHFELFSQLKPELEGYLQAHWREIPALFREGIFFEFLNKQQEGRTGAQFIEWVAQLIDQDPSFLLRESVFPNLVQWMEITRTSAKEAHSPLQSEHWLPLAKSLNRAFNSLPADALGNSKVLRAGRNDGIDGLTGLIWFTEFPSEHLTAEPLVRGLSHSLSADSLALFYEHSPKARALLERVAALKSETILARLKRTGLSAPQQKDMQQLREAMLEIPALTRLLRHVPQVRALEEYLDARAVASAKHWMLRDDEGFLKRALHALETLAFEHHFDREKLWNLPIAYDNTYVKPKPLNPKLEDYLDVFLLTRRLPSGSVLPASVKELLTQRLATQKAPLLQAFLKIAKDKYPSREMQPDRVIGWVPSLFDAQARRKALIDFIQDEKNGTNGLGNIFHWLGDSLTPSDVLALEVDSKKKAQVAALMAWGPEEALRFANDYWQKTRESVFSRTTDIMGAVEALSAFDELFSHGGQNAWTLNARELVDSRYQKLAKEALTAKLVQVENADPEGYKAQLLKALSVHLHLESGTKKGLLESIYPQTEKALRQALPDDQLDWMNRIQNASSSVISLPTDIWKRELLALLPAAKAPYEEKLELAGFLTDGDVLRKHQFWETIAEPHLKQEAYDEESARKALGRVYGNFQSYKYRRINDIANYFRLPKPAIESLEHAVYPDKTKALMYKEVQAFQSAVKKLLLEKTTTPESISSAIRWLQSDSPSTPEMIRKIVRTMQSDMSESLPRIWVPGMPGTEFQSDPEFLRDLYQKHSAAARLMMLEDFISPYHKAGLWHPENQKGRAYLFELVFEGLAKENLPLARALFEAHTEGLDESGRGHVFLAKLLAGRSASGAAVASSDGGSTDVDKLKAFLETSGGLWIKVGQLLSADPSLITDANARKTLQVLNDRASEPLRRNLIDLIEKRFGSELEKVGEVGLVLGSGSMNVSAEVFLKDGRSFVARMIRSDEANRALFDRDDIRNTARKLREKAHDYPGAAPSQLLQIADALEESIDMLVGNMQVESDLRKDRKATTLLADGEAYQKSRESFKVRSRLVTEAKEVLDYAEGKADAEKLILYPTVRDADRSDQKLTPSERLRVRKAQYLDEFEAIFERGVFDPDGHKGNWLVTRGEGGWLESHRIDTSQALAIDKPTRESLQTVLRGILRKQRPELWGIEVLEPEFLARAFANLLDSDLPESKLVPALAKLLSQIAPEREDANPVRMAALVRSRLRAQFPNHKVRFKHEVQAAVKSLFITQQLLDLDTEKYGTFSAAQRAQLKQFGERVFAKTALALKPKEKLWSGAGIALQKVRSFFSKQAPVSKQRGKAASEKQEQLDVVRAIIQEHRRLPTFGEMEEWWETHPDLRPELITYARKSLLDSEVAQHPTLPRYEAKLDRYSRNSEEHAAAKQRVIALLQFLKEHDSHYREYRFKVAQDRPEIAEDLAREIIWGNEQDAFEKLLPILKDRRDLLASPEITSRPFRRFVYQEYLEGKFAWHSDYWEPYGAEIKEAFDKLLRTDRIDDALSFSYLWSGEQKKILTKFILEHLKQVESDALVRALNELDRLEEITPILQEISKRAPESFAYDFSELTSLAEKHPDWPIPLEALLKMARPGYKDPTKALRLHLPRLGWTQGQVDRFIQNSELTFSRRERPSDAPKEGTLGDYRYRLLPEEFHILDKSGTVAKTYSRSVPSLDRIAEHLEDAGYLQAHALLGLDDFYSLLNHERYVGVKKEFSGIEGAFSNHLATFEMTPNRWRQLIRVLEKRRNEYIVKLPGLEHFLRAASRLDPVKDAALLKDLDPALARAALDARMIPPSRVRQFRQTPLYAFLNALGNNTFPEERLSFGEAEHVAMSWLKDSNKEHSSVYRDLKSLENALTDRSRMEHFLSKVDFKSEAERAYFKKEFWEKLKAWSLDIPPPAPTAKPEKNLKSPCAGNFQRLAG